MASAGRLHHVRASNQQAVGSRPSRPRHLGWRAKVAGLAVLGLVTQFAAAPPSLGSTAPVGRWLMLTNLVNKLRAVDPATAAVMFDTPLSFVKPRPAGNFSATRIVGYTSYAQFAADLAHGRFPRGVHWVMYGLESTTDSPMVEKQQPDVYLKKFALLAHRHGLHVMEVPGRDLVGVSGSDCHARVGERYDAAYLRCHIPADAAAADIFLVEAQADQWSVPAYVGLVRRATAQAEAANPHLTVMAGLTTDRGSTAAAVEQCWAATHTSVAGYWMNSTTGTLPVAAAALDAIAAAAGHAGATVTSRRR